MQTVNVQEIKAPNQETATAIGLDIGGTKLLFARIDEQNHVINPVEIPTPDDEKVFFDTLAKQLNALLTEDPNISIIGIATAGIVNAATGEILGATGNLPAFQQYRATHQGTLNLSEELRNRLIRPVFIYVENDGNAAAYGEYADGAAKGFRNVVMITLGTGIGGGIILNGRMIHGEEWAAAEVGHMGISLNHTRTCTCGRPDCWEIYASGTGFRLTVVDMIKAHTETPEQEESDVPIWEDPAMVDAREIIRSAKQSHDPLAVKILDTWHDHITAGLRALVNSLNPGIVVIGGGMGKYVDFELLAQKMSPLALAPAIASHIVPARLGNRAGVVGAVELARQAYRETVETQKSP